MTAFNKLKEFITYFNTPFKRPKLKFYFGRVSLGTPYFLPRKAIKDNEKGGYKFVPKKIGFDIVTLGWKTKWDQFRFEWSPIISFVFFKWQIAITINAIEKDHYWESWVHYQFRTDKKKSKYDRAIQCQMEYPQKWIRTIDGVETEIDFYDSILKRQYRMKTQSQVRDEKINSILDLD